MRIRVTYTLTYPVNINRDYDSREPADVMATDAPYWRDIVHDSIDEPAAGDVRSVRFDVIDDGEHIIATVHPEVDR
jgi:hypothetical protein